MLRKSVSIPRRYQSRILLKTASSPAPFSSSSSRRHAAVNPALNLDPSYTDLLKDVNISLKNQKSISLQAHRELEVIPGTSSALQVSMDDWSSLEISSEPKFEEEYEAREHRKSPAALFGSDQISLTILPLELQMAISGLVSG